MMIKFKTKTFLFFLVLITLFFKLSANDEAIDPPNPAAIDQTVLHYFDAEGEDLEKRIEAFTLTLHKYEAIGNKRIEAILSKIHLSLKSLISTSYPTDDRAFAKTDFADGYDLEDIIALYHQSRKKKLDIKSLHEEEKENKRGLDAAYDNFDRELKFYQKIHADSPEKIECGLETLYNFILLKIGENKQKFFQNKIIKAKSELTFLENELAHAKNKIIIGDSYLVALKNEAKISKNDWLATKSAHLEKEADLLLDNQEQSVKQEILKSSLKELNAKQKFLHSEIKYTLATALKDREAIDVSKVKQKISSWEILISNFHQLTDHWLSKLHKAIQRYGEILTLNVKNNESPEAYTIAQENLLSLQSLQSNTDDIEFLVSLLKEQTTILQGGLTHAFNSLRHYFVQGFTYLKNALDTTLFHIGLTPVTYWGIIRFFLILLLTLFISRFLIRTLSTYALETKKVQRSIVYRLSRLLHYLVLVIGLLLALLAIGFDFSNLLLVAGALGVGLGFGLQSIFNNFISGLIMLFESQLKIGDFIEVAPGVRGEIREINVRSTLLTTPDGVEVIVPNAEFISNRITNWTFRHNYRRLHIPFSVAYGSNPEQVQEVILNLAKKMPDTLIKPGFEEPQVILIKLSESSMDFELVLWVCKIKGSTQSDYLIGINQALIENDIVQPFPQREMSISNLLGARNLEEMRQLFNLPTSLDIEKKADDSSDKRS